MSDSKESEHVHSYTQVTDPYKSDGATGFSCDKCSKKVKDSPSWHCNCNYDLCDACYAKRDVYQIKIVCGVEGEQKDHKVFFRAECKPTDKMSDLIEHITDHILEKSKTYSYNPDKDDKLKFSLGGTAIDVEKEGSKTLSEYKDLKPDAKFYVNVWKKPVRKMTDPWICLSCTFQNVTSSRTCEMCSTPDPTPLDDDDTSSSSSSSSSSSVTITSSSSSSSSSSTSNTDDGFSLFE